MVLGLKVHSPSMASRSAFQASNRCRARAPGELGVVKRRRSALCETGAFLDGASQKWALRHLALFPGLLLRRLSAGNLETSRVYFDLYRETPPLDVDIDTISLLSRTTQGRSEGHLHLWSSPYKLHMKKIPSGLRPLPGCPGTS